MKGKTILVADDDQTILNLFGLIFEREGCRVIKATNGQDAVEDVKTNAVDIAILDIRMPIMGGLEALREIKQFDPSIEVLLVTGYADIENFREAITSQGAFDYILKPFNVVDILQTTRNAVSKRESVLKKEPGKWGAEPIRVPTGGDVTERTRQLRESQVKYRQIIDNSNDMILAIQDGKIKFANPKTLELTGYSEEEISRIPASEIIHFEDRALTAEMDGRTLAGEVPPTISTFRILRKTGEGFWAEANTIRSLWEEKPAAIKFIRDISERKRAEEKLRKAYEELKEMQGQLIHSEKMAALGRFSAGITHEIKNPLSVMIGGIDYLAKKLAKEGEDVQVALKKIKEAALRADHILMGLLKFSRPSKLVVEKTYPTDLLQDTLSFLKYREPFKNIRLVTQWATEELPIQVDKSQIQQVLFNLFLNAVEAMPEEGQITVRTYKEPRCEHLAGKPACIIQITDTGEGVSPENLSKIFEPFFTTKRDKKGTGLGLSISKMIVDKHGGNLIIQSEQGKGTDVRVILPLGQGGEG